MSADPGAARSAGPMPATPSRMVAEVGSAESLATASRVTTGYSPIYVGALWNPRRQRAEGREQWREDVTESVRKSRIPTSTLSEQPPTATSVIQRYPKMTSEQVTAKYAEDMTEYQERNTALWDVVKPSLDLSGPDEMSDREEIRKKYMIGDIRDGYGLYQWADEKGDQTDVLSQVELQRRCPTGRCSRRAPIAPS